LGQTPFESFSKGMLIEHACEQLDVMAEERLTRDDQLEGG